MRIAATGHRPQRLQSDWSQYHTTTLPRLTHLALSAFERLTPSLVISGMALGWDTAIALAALKLKIPLVAEVPCRNHTSAWKDVRAIATWNHIIKNATTVYIPDVDYSPQCMQARNIRMVDSCDLLLALWDGSSGGTANCIAYAKTKKKEVLVLNLWSSWQKYKGF